MKKLIMMIGAAVVAVGAYAADLTVAQGASQTISGDATYDAVVVNGSLTVAPDVTLTCTSLTVADGISGTATLTVGDGGKVVVTGDGIGATKIGVGAGEANVILGSSANLTVAGWLNFCTGYASAPASSAAMTKAFLVVGTNATVDCGADFCFGHDNTSSTPRYYPSGASPSSVRAEVLLNRDSVLSAKRINQRLSVSAKIVFNGGRISKTGDYSGGGFITLPTTTKNVSLYLTGTNSCPICFHLPDRGRYASFASYGAKSRRVVMQGDGGFRKTGAGMFPLADSASSYWDSNLRFLFTGNMTIAEGGFSVATSPTNNVFVAANPSASVPVNIVVKNGAVFDFAGCDVVVNSITADGSGVVTNSVATTATATLLGDNSRDSTLARVFSGIAIEKKGNASLSLCGANIDSVDVQDGTLVVKNRIHMGYPFYRFQVDAIRTSEANKRVNINEFAMIADGADVTRPYAALYHNASGSDYVTSPTNLVDGDLSTTYYDLRITSSEAERRARVGVTLEYDRCLAVDAYRWAPFQAYSHETDPAAWRVLGGFSTTDLVVLDQVAGFRVSDVVDGWNSTNFVFTSTESSAMHIGTLTLADGVSVKMEGAQVSCGTLGLGAACSLYVKGDRASIKGNLLSASSCSGTENLDGWSVYHNGIQLDRKLFFDGNAVRLFPLGIMLIVE